MVCFSFAYFSFILLREEILLAYGSTASKQVHQDAAQREANHMTVAEPSFIPYGLGSSHCEEGYRIYREAVTVFGLRPSEAIGSNAHTRRVYSRKLDLAKQRRALFASSDPYYALFLVNF